MSERTQPPLDDAVDWCDCVDAEVPAGYCPNCTKELEDDGWCFECRKTTEAA